MTFLYPAFLLGALAIAIPLLLHLLRRDVAPQVPFSAVRLLQRTPLEQSRPRRLRDLLLLAARIAAVVLLAAAFARPYLPQAAAAAPLHIVALDRSLSMGAPARFGRALELARAAIDEAPAGGRVVVIAFDDRAEIVAGPGSAAVARAALDPLRPGFGSTRYETLLQRAREIGRDGPARLTIVTDLQRAGWENGEVQKIPSDLDVRILDAGAVERNLAVTAVRRTDDGVVAEILNAGRAPVPSEVRVRVDGAIAGTAAVVAQPGERAAVSLPLPLPRRGTVAVDVDDPDGYPGDNVRYLAGGPGAELPVLIVGAGDGRHGFYVSRALGAAVTEPAYATTVLPSASLGRMSLDEVRRHVVVVMLSTRGLDRAGRELVAAFVRAGGGLMVAASPDVDPAMLASLMGWSDLSAREADIEDAALAATDLRHPVFQAFGPLAANLGQVRFSRIWRVNDAGWQVAGRFSDGSPALLERRAGEGRVVLFASDLDRRWNAFPLHPAFVPFVVEVVRHAGGVRHAGREYLVGRAPAGAGPEPGVYPARSDGREIAVNVDPRESSTGRMTVDEFRAMLRPLEARSAPAAAVRAERQEGDQSLWRYGFLFMLAALVAESFAGRRR